MQIRKDIVIFGGGIAGLWLLDRLHGLGYDVALLENRALGGGQSIASQGMIHGGIKYALGGQLTGASTAIADMPACWRRCLAGEGEVDLRGARVLSDTYYMWPRESLRSRLNAFLGSHALRGRVEALAPEALPDFFRGRIRGPLYRLQDLVLDVPSLLQTLASRHRERLHLVDWQTTHIKAGADGITQLVLPNGNELVAHRYVCSSGEGATFFLEALGARQVAMQRRPLKMVVLRQAPADPVYVHLVSERMSATPELTITTHACRDGSHAWYLGGDLAERGVGRSDEEQLAAARALLTERFPWYDYSTSPMYCFPINRAEARQPDGKRPDNATLLQEGNLYYAWPTKLTLAPVLAQQLITRLQAEDIRPGFGSGDRLQALPPPPLATPPWEFTT